MTTTKKTKRVISSRLLSTLDEFADSFIVETAETGRLQLLHYKPVMLVAITLF